MHEEQLKSCFSSGNSMSNDHNRAKSNNLNYVSSTEYTYPVHRGEEELDIPVPIPDLALDNGY
jgi:hypothetical protein